MEMHLGAVELRFARLIWEHSPIASGELVKLCEKELQWKKSTTYTVLRRLCDKGLFKNEGGTVTALMTEREYESGMSGEFLRESFGGSLPAFLAAFSASNSLSDKDINELQRLIDNARNKK